MTETAQLNLPLLSPAQAQKHVTVNEALSRLDGMVQLRLISISQTTPPATALEGDCYGVPANAVNAWAGQAGKVAIAANGGWDFVTPRRGWRAMILDQGVVSLHDGSAWRGGGLTLSPGGAGMSIRSVEIDVPITAGSSVTSPVIFPDRSIAFGVTGLVIEEITGAATSWSLGVTGDLQRYGNGLGTAVNSFVAGPGAPLVYWTPTALELTADGGDFAGGAVRLVAHFAELSLPDWV